MGFGQQIGLLDSDKFNQYLEKQKQVDELLNALKTTKITPKTEVIEYLSTVNSNPITDKVDLLTLLRRPEIKIHLLNHFINLSNWDEEVLQQVEIDVKYDGYIDKANKLVEKLSKQDNIKIPSHFDYAKIQNIASEAKDKLQKVRPLTLGQASRISGVNPNDIAILSFYIKSNQTRNQA
jgi:tRNA uridine 5-carboxymethylaminomethyl modification enzyme